MLQLPLLETKPQALSTGTSTDRMAGLAELLGLSWDAALNDTELLAGMGGLLQQLPLELRQRFEQLLNGGMDLPQAARTLLSEGLTETGGRFQDVLQQRLLGPRSPGAVLGPSELPLGTDAVPRLAEALLTPSAAAGVPLPSVVGVAPLSMPAPIAPTTTLPPQLAGNLLEMGIPQPVAARGWDAALADRVSWMVQGEQQFARLRLNPPNLGPLDVRISVQQDQTSVTFIAQHAAVREALEAALPRLREMFDQQSLQLVRADVSDPGTRQGGQTGAGQGQDRTPGEDTDQDSVPAEPLQTPMSEVRAVRGLIDLFA